jgi:hypothetical protein
MRLRLVPVVIAALLAGACSDATAPGPVNDEGVVVPDDGTIVLLGETQHTPRFRTSNQPTPTHPDLSFMVNGVSGGKFAISCTKVGSTKRCTLLYIMATATTTAAIATCVGSSMILCSGALIGTGYAWDQFFAEPDCYGCKSPFDRSMYDPWTREDFIFPIGVNDDGEN